MSMIALANHLRIRRRGIGRSLLLIGVTAAIIIGLLAMHSLGGHTSHAEQTAIASVHDMGAAHHEDALPAAGECADCDADMSMLAITCVLALLAVALLLSARPLAPCWRAGLPREVAPRAAPTPVDLEPPSLHNLCISRT
jgi:hypothetical protein